MVTLIYDEAINLDGSQKFQLKPEVDKRSLYFNPTKKTLLNEMKNIFEKIGQCCSYINIYNCIEVSRHLAHFSKVQRIGIPIYIILLTLLQPLPCESLL